MTVVSVLLVVALLLAVAVLAGALPVQFLGAALVLCIIAALLGWGRRP